MAPKFDYPAMDFETAQPYPVWEQARGECPVIQVSGMSLGVDGTTYQVTRWDDVEHVLRDPETFSSSINAEHIGQFMGDLILAMDGKEHRSYRNLVAPAFRASQLEKWGDSMIGPTIGAAARRHRAARSRRPGARHHVEVPGAGHLRDRRRAASRTARSSTSGPSRSTGVRCIPRSA